MPNPIRANSTRVSLYNWTGKRIQDGPVSKKVSESPPVRVLLSWIRTQIIISKRTLVVGQLESPGKLSSLVYQCRTDGSSYELQPNRLDAETVRPFKRQDSSRDLLGNRLCRYCTTCRPQCPARVWILPSSSEERMWRSLEVRTSYQPDAHLFRGRRKHLDTLARAPLRIIWFASSIAD
jgi:hypothetical protein